MKRTTTVGMDLGDKFHQVCALDDEGNVLENVQISNTHECVAEYFSRFDQVTVAMEAGTYSPWVSRNLEGMGHRVIVANARKLKAVSQNVYKSDVRDAELLARMVRSDLKLLNEIKHKSERAQKDLIVIKTRDLLVRQRASQISHMRGVLKSFGIRVKKHSSESFHKKVVAEIPSEFAEEFSELLDGLASLTMRIKNYDKKIRQLSQETYPETAKLQKIAGVGPIASLCFVLTLDDPARFAKSRDVGPYLGLVPRRDQSGAVDKQLPITKAGDKLMRRLLMQNSQYIMGSFGPDCDLKRYGQRIAARGGKNAQRRAKVAVARKLAVLMHHLWIADEEYQPFYRDNGNCKAA